MFQHSALHMTSSKKVQYLYQLIKYLLHFYFLCWRCTFSYYCWRQFLYQFTQLFLVLLVLVLRTGYFWYIVAALMYFTSSAIFSLLSFLLLARGRRNDLCCLFFAQVVLYTKIYYLEVKNYTQKSDIFSLLVFLVICGWTTKASVTTEDGTVRCWWAYMYTGFPYIIMFLLWFILFPELRLNSLNRPKIILQCALFWVGWWHYYDLTIFLEIRLCWHTEIAKCTWPVAIFTQGLS